MTIKNTVKEYSKYLVNITHIPAKEVEILILHLLSKNIIWLHLNYNEEFNKEQELKKLVEKRKKNFPLEYLTNKASFYGEQFHVQEGVLIPRPETELLIEKVLPILEKIANPKIIEIGVGSGIISVMLARLIPNISIIAVDINEKALELAKKNAKYHEVEHKITFLHSNLFENIKEDTYDMVVSNPPYIKNDFDLEKNVRYEPSNALFGGEEGDELLKKIIIETKNRNIQYLVCEMGYDQEKPLRIFINKFEYKKLEFYKDYENFDRGFTLSFKK